MCLQWVVAAHSLVALARCEFHMGVWVLTACVGSLVGLPPPYLPSLGTAVVHCGLVSGEHAPDQGPKECLGATGHSRPIGHTL